MFAMAALGIEVILRFIDFNTLVVKISDAFDYGACLLGVGGGAGDPAASKDIYSSGGRLHQWYPSQATPDGLIHFRKKRKKLISKK